LKITPAKTRIGKKLKWIFGIRPKNSFDLKSLPIIIGIITAWSTTCGKTQKKQYLPEREDKNIMISYIRLINHKVFRTRKSTLKCKF